jgi:transcriptional regulator with XRE-family HTH domain
LKERESLARNTHFLGAKLRSLRKRHGWTLADLSQRCTHIHAKNAPSVSYLSLIETGNRVPSRKVLTVLAEVFQRSTDWFLDESLGVDAVPARRETGGRRGMALEPAFLFSKEMMEKSIPEVLLQTGTSGRQFAQILIRSYQESRRNQFPDLERIAERIGGKTFPWSVDGLIDLCRHHGLTLHWFDRPPFETRDDSGHDVRTLFRSFAEPGGHVYLNRRLRREPARLKYDLAVHLGHRVLHGGDGSMSCHATGGDVGGSPRPVSNKSHNLEQEDILTAWRDFECSFFAGALLCPRVPFRHFLMRHAHDPFVQAGIDLTPAVLMRRMTAVSPYPHWHYFDAYPPGYLRAVYRADGIPSPWGNLRRATDPCRRWPVFRALDSKTEGAHPARLSLLIDSDERRLFVDLAGRTRDAVGTTHVICVGLDLAPALAERGVDVDRELENLTATGGLGSEPIGGPLQEALRSVARVMNIGWIEPALDVPVEIICPRRRQCPRATPCEGEIQPPRVHWIGEVRRSILNQS